MTANGLSEKKNSILEINDLCFAYPEEKKRALNHASLHVEDGEFLVLCGKSGCGKSTLLTHLKTRRMESEKERSFFREYQSGR